MQKHIDFETAKVINKLGYNNDVNEFYLNVRTGLKIVRTDGVEKIFYEGSLCSKDIDWQIEYPSPYWIPAPFIFDVISWLELNYGIKIIPIYDKEINQYIGYNIYSIVDNLNNIGVIERFSSYETLFEHAIKKIIKTLTENGN